MDPTSAPVAERRTETEVQRLADLELFVRGVVHDLNNALNVMQTNLYLLRQRLPADEIKVQRPLNRIEDQVGTIGSMLEGYQALYHAAQPSCQRLDLSELIRKVLPSVGIPEGYELLPELDPQLPPVEADPKLIEASVRAILRNSIRAMPGMGEIRVITRRAGDRVELVVEDTGPGLPAEIADRVFEPFVSTWPEHAGLGLALVERVAASHGGSASASSSPGAGTRVTIQLPISER
jgi:signal transduction histidine kinase